MDFLFLFGGKKKKGEKEKAKKYFKGKNMGLAR